METNTNITIAIQKEPWPKALEKTRGDESGLLYAIEIPYAPSLKI